MIESLLHKRFLFPMLSYFYSFRFVLLLIFTSAWVVILGGGDRASAQQSQPADPDVMKLMIDQLQQEYQDQLDQWKQSDQLSQPVLESPFVTSDTLTANLPSACKAHLEMAKASLEQDQYSQEAWQENVFSCETCCAPLLADIMEIHVAHVIASPHLVVLFKFDDASLQERARPQIDALLQQFDPLHDDLLLIGRASHIGDRAHNLILSGKRAGEIKDYAIDQFSIESERIHYLFFGYDPPQLTPELAVRYGLTDENIAAIDHGRPLSVASIVNQSVVVIIKKHKDVVAQTETQVSIPVGEQVQAVPALPVADVLTPSAPQPSPAEVSLPAVVTPSVPVLAIAPLASDEHKRPIITGSERSDDAATFQPTRVLMSTDPPGSPSSRFGLEVAFLAWEVGLDITLAESENTLDTIRGLLTSVTPALGIIPSNTMGYLGFAPEPGIDHTEVLRLLFPLYNEAIHLFARRPVQQIQDLKGKRVLIDRKGSQGWMTAHQVLQVFEVKPAELIESLSPAKAIAAVLNGDADAMFYVGEKPAKPFELIQGLQADPEWASLIQTVHFVPLHPAGSPSDYVPSDIGPSDYAWLRTTIPTLAVKAVLASAYFKGDGVLAHCQKLAAFGQFILDNLPKLKRTGHAKWREVNLHESLPSWKHDTCLPSVQR